MHGWKPEAPNEFAGDMMPFWDGHAFHLFYLLDRDHHGEQGGLGGHQWAHASSSDLVQWRHHPLSLPVGAPGSVDQHGICTGSIFAHDGIYHAFYATRIKRADGSVYEAICRAQSRDLMHFDKSTNNPMFGASDGLDARNHRDPFVFQDKDGIFHMIVTASRDVSSRDVSSRDVSSRDVSSRDVSGEAETPGEHGVLAHYVSDDLEGWRAHAPFAIDGDPTPECPEHFRWNDWWYLVYSQHGQLQYWISRDELGPWQRARRGTIEGRNLAVPRSAGFTDNRRIAVGFLAWRNGSRDNGGWAYAGNAVFRELKQDADGTLSTDFVRETMPPTAPPLAWQVRNASRENGAFELQSDMAPMASIAGVPTDCTLSLRFVPGAAGSEFGLLLRADEKLETGYRLSFVPSEKRVTLQRWPVQDHDSRSDADDVEGLDGAIDVVILIKDCLVDVCINNQRTLIERAFDYRGTHLGFYLSEGEARIENASIAPLL